MKCLARGKKIILAAVLSLAMVCTSNMYYENEKNLNVYAATEKEATDIGISSTADVILYAENGTGATAKLQAANTEYLETQLTGGTTFKKLEYYFEAKNMDKQYVNDCFVIKKDNDTTVSFTGGKAVSTLSTGKNGVPKFYITAGEGYSEGATLEVTVTMWLTNRTTPMVRRAVFTLDNGLTVPTALEVTATRDIIRTGVETVIKTNMQPTDSNATIFYKITKDKQSISDELTGGVHTLQSTDGKTEYATFDENTGIFKASVAGVYEFIPVASAFSGKPITKIVNVVDLSFENISVEAGRSVTKGNFIYAKGDTVGGLNANNCKVTYAVANENIATIESSGEAYGANLKVTGVKPGFTKITATVTSMDKNVNYYITKEAYIVVAPKSSAKDFSITDTVGNSCKEAYINELVACNRANIAVLRNATKELLNGTLDSVKLSKDAIERMQGTFEADYPYYYSEKIDNKVSTTTITTTGLTLAFASSKVVDSKDPLNTVKVVMTCNKTDSGDDGYVIRNSVVNFKPSFTRYGKDAQPDRALWFTVKNSSLKNGTQYAIYNNKQRVCIQTAENNTVSFVVDNPGVISISKSLDNGVADTKMSAWLIGKETNNGEVVDNGNGGSSDNGDSSNGSSSGSDSSGGNSSDSSEDPDDEVVAPALDMRFIGYVQDEGLKNEVVDTNTGIISLGTYGKSRRFESLIIYGIDKDDIKVTAHIQNRGDVTPYAYDESGGLPLGDSGSGLRMEAISMQLLNRYGKAYDIYYRVHVQDYGWLGWAKNGEMAGTSGHSFRIEGIEIAIVKKGTTFDTSKYVKTYEEGNRGKDGQAAYMDRK